MRRLWTAVLTALLTLGGGLSASALTIDSFSAGFFNVQGGAAAPTVASIVCGGTCLGGQREISIQAAGGLDQAGVQLSVPQGEAANVMPGAGGDLSFTYRDPAGVDLTLGGLATLSIEVVFTVFEPGAQVTVELEDASGKSHGESQTPPGSPGIVGFPLIDFASDLDLMDIVRIKVLVRAGNAGDYHVTHVAIPNPSLGGGGLTPFTMGNSFTTNAPGALPIMIQAHTPSDDAIVDVELWLTDVSLSGAPLPGSIQAELDLDSCWIHLSVGIESRPADGFGYWARIWPG